MHAKKTDKNQIAIVRALRKIGATVVDASMIGKGFPDLIVGYRGVTLLLEVKNPENKWRLTQDQIYLHQQWNGGKILIVTDAEGAVDAVNNHTKLLNIKRK